MTIYIDQMFLENFIMNYIILYITSKFSGVKSKWYQLSIGAIIGAIYVILSYTVGFYNKHLIVFRILLSIVMILASFRIKSIKDFGKLILFFYAVTFFVGGASFGLAYFLNVSMIAKGGVLYVEEFPVVMVAFGTMLTVIIGKWLIIFLKNRINFDELLYNIDISLFDKTVKILALLDSGNNVREQFTGYPVIIVQKEILDKIIPEIILGKIKNDDFEIEEKWKKRLRIIPISTVSTENEILVGFKIDKCVVHTKYEDKEIKNVIVASCNRKLSKEGKYNALIGNVF